MKLKKTPGLVTIGIASVVVVVMWIGFEVYRALTKEPDISIPPQVLRELNPTLNQNALNDLQQRIHLSDSQIGEGTILVTRQLQTVPEEVLPEPTTVPEASPSGSTETADSEATTSADLETSL